MCGICGVWEYGASEGSIGISVLVTTEDFGTTTARTAINLSK